MKPSHFRENDGFTRNFGRTNVLCVILTHPLKIYCILIYNGYIMKKMSVAAPVLAQGDITRKKT